jgi:hypothetical protein
MELVEPKLYIFEAPPFIMVVESASNFGDHFAMYSCQRFVE